jgi:hypothetical protein
MPVLRYIRTNIPPNQTNLPSIRAELPTIRAELPSIRAELTNILAELPIIRTNFAPMNITFPIFAMICYQNIFDINTIIIN